MLLSEHLLYSVEEKSNKTNKMNIDDDTKIRYFLSNVIFANVRNYQIGVALGNLGLALQKFRSS